MTDSCDILVLGGGPAGSASATMLSDAGYKVVILEREKFPREHVGESLLPASIPILEQIGVMPEIERAGFVTKHGATLVWGADPEPWSWYFADDPGQRPTSFQVVRSEFDDILLKNASKHGVEVIEEAQVLDVIFENEELIHLYGRTSDGKTHKRNLTMYSFNLDKEDGYFTSSITTSYGAHLGLDGKCQIISNDEVWKFE